MNRKEIGEILAKIRNKKNISTYKMVKAGIRLQTMKAIEKGSSNYTIDTLLLYVDTVDAQIVIKDKPVPK